MNKKGQNLVLSILAAGMIFIAGMLFLNHIMGDVSLARTVGIDCTATDLTSGAKVTCLGYDLVIPILIVTIVSVSAGAILSRFLI